MGVNFNQVILAGRLTKDPEIKQLNTMQSATFALAVERFKKKEDGTYEADFVNIKAFDKLAEISSKYLRKGKPVLVVGRLHIHEYEKDGERKWFTEVVADNIQFLDTVSKDNKKKEKK
jgi:single-strand DNA-binding protein